jgi:hypothetical protein
LAADELGGNLIGGAAGEEGLEEVLGKALVAVRVVWRPRARHEGKEEGYNM